MIPDETVELVRDSADIVQIIGEHVNLKKTGSDFRGPCPFHQGVHRNFSVSPKKRMYYCFVCNAGGDVFNFLQKHLGIEWPAAVRMVAEKVGVDVPDNAPRREGPDPREKLWEVNATAGEYFRRMLWEDDNGRPARAYLEDRRITREVAERFELGWAPREIGSLRTFMNALGFDDPRLIENGLLVAPDEHSEPRPRFRGRLMFPIQDPAGRPVGFGGRLIAPGEPKYLNSPESPVFSKGKLLYALHRAKQSMRKEERVLVVEGYFDVIRLHAAGLESAVAPLGTALTAEQVTLLRRYARTAWLLYDSDQPGLKATFRAADALLAQGVGAQVVTLPDGEDPDTFVDRHGREALEELISSSLDVIERKIQILERAGWFASLRQRRMALDRLFETIRVTTDPIMRDLYISRASEASGVSRELLLREVGGGATTSARGDEAREESGVETGGPPRGSSARDPSDGGLRPKISERRRRTTQRGEAGERLLLTVMLHSRGRIDSIAERISGEDFWDAGNRRIFAALLAQGSDATPAEIAAALEPDDIPVLESLLGDADSIGDIDRTIEGSIAMLRRRVLYARLAVIDRELPLATDLEKNELMAEKGRLRKQVEDLGRGGMRFGKSRR